MVLFAAVSLWWLAQEDARDVPTEKDAITASPGDAASSPAPSTRPGATSTTHRSPEKNLPRPTLLELAVRHETKPDAGEWDTLLGLLKQPLPESPSEEDREIAEAVKARFAAHAGSAQIDELASIFHNSSSMEIGQNALEILSTLQSAEFQARAREIVADTSLPADDQIVTALARSLAHNGTPQDIALILDRIDTGKARDPSEYDGMDGLMSAIHGALAPEMEPVLCDALSNTDGSRTWLSRLAAATALQNHSTSSSTRALSQAAQSDPDPRVAAAAADSLAYLRTQEE